MKRLSVLLMLSLSVFAHADNVYCGGSVQRIQIENDRYMVWLGDSLNSATIHELGTIDTLKAEKYFTVALTAYATGDNFTIRYANPASNSCAQLRTSAAQISYTTMHK